MISRTAIISEAQSWKGIKWRHQGRTREGVDCVGLIVVVGHALGLSKYDYGEYGRDPDGSFIEHFDAVAESVSRGDKQPGDIAIFTDAKFPGHVGWFSMNRGNLTVIHSHASRRKVVEEVFDFELKDKLIDVYRFAGVSPWPS